MMLPSTFPPKLTLLQTCAENSTPEAHVEKECRRHQHNDAISKAFYSRLMKQPSRLLVSTQFGFAGDLSKRNLGRSCRLLDLAARTLVPFHFLRFKVRL